MATIVVENSDLIFYYTGHHVDDGYAVITDNGVHLLTDMRYYGAVSKSDDISVSLIEDVSLVDLLKRFGATEVLVVMEYTSAKLYGELLSAGFSVNDGAEAFYESAMVKSSEEIENLKKSASICEKAFLKVLPLIKEGVTELEIAAALEYNFKLLGATKPSFETIVAFGSGSAIPHYKTSNVKLTKNTPILMDFGCYYNGYASDMTRTLFFGEPNEKFVERYNLVLSAHELAFNNAKEGASAKMVHELVCKHFEQYGVNDKFTHSLGHGVGVKIHEEPRLSRKSDRILSEGNVFTIEPGLYFDGEYGIRIEDTVMINNGVAETLFTHDKKLIVIQ